MFICNEMSAQSHREKTLLLQGYKKYQTFNEFKMSGEGEVVDTPFVYVKRETKDNNTNFK